MRSRLFALLAAAALVAGACGSDSDTDPAGDASSTTQVEAPVTTGGSGDASQDGDGGTFGDLVPALQEESARFEGTMVAVGSPGSQLTEAIEVLVSGSMDPSREAVHISMDMSGLARAALGSGEDLPPQFTEMFDEPMEVVTIGGSSWLRFPLLAMVTGADTDWIAVEPEEAGELTSGLGLGSEVTSPTGLLDQLRDARAQVEEVGTEDVRGVETTHYRVRVDLDQLAQSLPEDERSELQQELGTIDALPVEVWVDDDGRLHRYRVDLTEAGDTPEVESASVEFEFFDHGADVDIQAPPDDQVTPMDELEGFLGGPSSTEATPGDDDGDNGPGNGG